VQDTVLTTAALRWSRADSWEGCYRNSGLNAGDGSVVTGHNGAQIRPDNLITPINTPAGLGQVGNLYGLSCLIYGGLVRPDRIAATWRGNQTSSPSACDYQHLLNA